MNHQESHISVLSESRQLSFPDGDQALVVLWQSRLLDRWQLRRLRLGHWRVAGVLAQSPKCHPRDRMSASRRDTTLINHIPDEYVVSTKASQSLFHLRLR